MFPQTTGIWLKINRYVPIWRHQSARIEPLRGGSIDYEKIKIEKVADAFYSKAEQATGDLGKLQGR
jgi:hypothetical protein